MTLVERLTNFANGCRGSMWQSRNETIELMDEAAARITALEARVDELVGAFSHIEQLRADEGDSVTILCDDPEADTVDQQLAVECCGAWTDWRERRLYGPSVAACLASAADARTITERPRHGQ